MIRDFILLAAGPVMGVIWAAVIYRMARPRPERRARAE
jgi:hypothetical protein